VNLPDGWVISSKPAHEALVSEADFIAAQDVNAARGPAPCGDPAVPQKRRYLLAGLLACATCGRRMEFAGADTRLTSRSVVARQTRGAPYLPIGAARNTPAATPGDTHN
jgi:site-specific DNA recombinase